MITFSIPFDTFAGYAGRTELPDNLKSMFRPISMVVPDSTLIAEIILFGEGFTNTKVFICGILCYNFICVSNSECVSN